MWWHYLVAIPAALLLTNGIPHFVQGITGKQHPSPFSGGPPNLDSAVRNVWWGGGNLIVGGVLLWLIHAGLGNGFLAAEMVVLSLAFATMLALVFGSPERFARRRKG